MPRKKAYFDVVPYKAADLTTAGNRLKAAEFRGMVHNSHLSLLVLTMAQTGKEATINMKKASSGARIEDCIVLGEDLKQSVREKYISKLLDKTLPNATAPNEDDDSDRMSKYIEMVEASDKLERPAIEGNGASPTAQP